MSVLRRLAPTVPLAVLVAFLAHAAGYGTSHATGGPHGGGLLGAALSSLALLALLVVVGVAARGRGLGPGEAAALVRRQVAGGDAAGRFAAMLALGGFVAYAGIELLEGRSPFAGPIALFSILPAAAAVALAVRAAGSWLGCAGLSLAALLNAERPQPLQSFSRLSIADGFRIAAAACPSARHGRAPPQLA